MSAGQTAALARWQRSLELLASMPPEITANMVNDRLLASVARLLRPDEDIAVELRVMILWAVGDPEARLIGELAGQLAGSVPGARPELVVVSLPSRAPGTVVREQLAGAHAVVVVAGFYDLVSAEPAAEAAGRLAEAARWLGEVAGRLDPDCVTIAVDGRTTRRSDPASRADEIQQKAVGRLGLPRSWPADVIVETGPDAVPGALAARVLRPFREDLAAAYAEATYGQVRHAVRYTERRCAGIREAITDITEEVPTDLRWTWLQAHAARRVAGAVAAALEAREPTDA
jgi:hypothetical protein